MLSRRQRLISPIRRNVVGRLCGRPTIVFLIFQIKKHGLGLSFRDKSFKMYDIASTVRSGWHTLWRKEQRCPAAKKPHSKNTLSNRFSSKYPRKLVRIFADLFAINAWFNILVVATYLPVRLTPKIFHLSVSHRKFLANCVCMKEPAMYCPLKSGHGNKGAF